jgi:MoxR-like ATPase
MSAQRLTRLIPVGEQVTDAILRVVRAARPGEEASVEINHGVAWGPSPRASQALMLGIRARALLQGRLSPSIDDVAELIGPVFKHRMALNFTARAEGETIEAIIARQKNLLA